MKGVAVCVVELPSILALASVQPRRLKHPVVRGLPETPTGDASFDEQFRVVTAPVLGAIPVTPEMQRLIMAHDDWSFRTERYRFACVRKDPFDSVEEMVQRIDEVLAIVAAIPSSVLPDRVDHSQDDLVARIAELDSVDDALEFLQHLTAGDREQLARSNTPLAAFADVTTPEEAIARFQAMDQGHQMQLLAMFERVADDQNS